MKTIFIMITTIVISGLFLGCGQTEVTGSDGLKKDNKNHVITSSPQPNVTDESLQPPKVPQL
jgi:hypothetical protein